MGDGKVIDYLRQARVIPLVVIDDADFALPLAATLASAGMRVAEVALRSPGAEAALAKMAASTDLLVGAGTVLSADQAQRCIDAGAQFVVSPGYDDDIVATCFELGTMILPGIATATELQRAHRAGLRAVKFFPAAQLGGLATLRALAGPFPDMSFVPTGGITATSASQYLQQRAVLAVAGSWMAPRDLVSDHRWSEIAKLCEEAASIVNACRPSTAGTARAG